MSIFRRPDYTSEVTSFINEMKANKPTLEAEQRAGRALLWDKPQVLTEQAEYREAAVAQQPYVYGSPLRPAVKPAADIAGATGTAAVATAALAPAAPPVK